MIAITAIHQATVVYRIQLFNMQNTQHIIGILMAITLNNCFQGAHRSCVNNTFDAPAINSGVYEYAGNGPYSYAANPNPGHLNLFGDLP